MLKSRLRITSCFLWLSLTMLGFYPSSPAKAETLTTYGASDFYFELESGNTFTVRATAQQYGIDSMFWLYNSNNTLLAANDDYYGLDSYISYNVQETGTYRLRTGVCCGDPNRWYGTSYTIEPSSVPTETPPQPTTTTTSTTTTTTLPPLGMRTPTNLQAIAYDGRVSLSWDAPEGGEGYAPVERYAVFFTDDNWRTSRAIASTTTWATVYNLENGTTYQFRVRADNDTLQVYSSTVETYTVSATPVTTTTTSTTTTTTSTSTTEVPTTSTQPPTTTSSSTSSVPFFSTLVSTSTTTVPVTTTAVTTTTLSPTTTTTTSVAPSTTLPEISSSTTIPPEQVVDAEVISLINAIANLPQSEVQEAVDNIIDEGVSAAEATALATNPEVLESVSAEQAAEIFDAVEVSDLSDAQAEQLVEAVQNASEEVKAEFEDQINIFEGKFDTYVPLGSAINVGQRKVLIAATGVLFMAPTVSVSSSTSGSSSSDSRRKK